jgi:hypothetical protein
MPISVLCPSCDTPVNAPDSAAGKRAKCPKCQEVMILPGGAEGFEVVDEPVPKKKPRVRVEEDEDERPTRKSRRRDEDEDEVDDERPKRKSSRQMDSEDERPSRKSRRRDEDDDRPRKKGAVTAGNSKGLWMGVRIAIMIAVGVGVYFALRDKDDADGQGAAQKSGIPDDWVLFTHPNEHYSVIFPDIPVEKPLPNSRPQAGTTSSLWQVLTDDRRLYQVVVQVHSELPPGDVPAGFLDRLCDRFSESLQPRAGKEISRTDTKLGGLTAKEMTYSSEAMSGVVRLAFTGKKMFAVVIMQPGKTVPADDLVRYFFNNFKAK